MTIHLRSFREGDGPALLALHTSAILASGDAFYSLAERQSWAHGLTPQGYSQAQDRGEIFVLATTAMDAIVGFCSWNRQRILGLYVHPDQQGRGIGSLLLRHGEDALRANGVTVSKIHSSLPALGFYQAHGYTVTERSRHHSRGGLMMDDAMLEKPLEQE